MGELLMIEQQGRRHGAVPWIIDQDGRRGPGQEDAQRLAQVRAGLLRHRDVRTELADVTAREIERTLAAVHEPGYLRALERVTDTEAVLMPELAAPGVEEPDTPVNADAVATAREGVGAAIAAARRSASGIRFTYALCRPPGHHAGPGWLGGYCYLNNAAAAVHTLHENGVGHVGILDLDLHYPNGTAALVAGMTRTTLHSLHGRTGANLPWHYVQPRSEREHLIAFRAAPDPDRYIQALRSSTQTLCRSAQTIVLSLGYDIVAGDPHGAWNFEPEIFKRIGGVLAGTKRPVCVVQEGGYALRSLADCSHAFVTGLLSGSGR